MKRFDANLDEAFKTAISRASGASSFGDSCSISSGSTLGKNIFVTPPPSIGQLIDSDRPRSNGSNEHFFSAGSTGGAARSSIIDLFLTLANSFDFVE
jgi:hypothetical protein